jgi:hypothetical protein
MIKSLFIVSNFLLRHHLRPNLRDTSLGASTSRYIRTMRIETDGQTGTITIHPEEGKHSASIVLMHGLGDSGEGRLHLYICI